MKLRRGTVLVIFAVLALGIGIYLRHTVWYPITNKIGSGTSIVAFGDSLTYGTGAGRGQDWPALLAAKSGRSIINKGVPGETTSDALQRVDKDVLSLEPRIVILGFGGNDVLQRVSEEQIFANLKTLIGEIQDSGAMVVLLGLNGFPFGGSLADGYKAVAREKGCVLVPNILGGILTNPKLKSDQVHPNAEGYKVMADRIYDKLKPYLRGGAGV